MDWLLIGLAPKWTCVLRLLAYEGREKTKEREERYPQSHVGSECSEEGVTYDGKKERSKGGVRLKKELSQTALATVESFIERELGENQKETKREKKSTKLL